MLILHYDNTTYLPRGIPIQLYCRMGITVVMVAVTTVLSLDLLHVSNLVLIDITLTNLHSPKRCHVQLCSGTFRQGRCGYTLRKLRAAHSRPSSLPLSSMPPRPRAENIQYAVKTDGVTPVRPANFDAHLAVVVSGATFRWKSLLPFLPWADEVVAAGVSPSSATISYFELEALLLILLGFRPGAETYSPIDAGLELDFIDRVLRVLAAADMYIITRPIADEEAFFGLVFPYVQGLKPPANAFLQVVPTAIPQFTPRGVAYADDLAWLESLTWKKLKSSRGSYAEARWFLRLLGPRASRDSRQNAEARLSLISKQLFSGWASIFEDFAFPPQVTAGLIAALVVHESQMANGPQLAYDRPQQGNQRPPPHVQV